ncbi:weak acid resistance protein 1 [Monosporozyma unispora]
MATKTSASQMAEAPEGTHAFTKENPDILITVIEGIPSNDPRLLGPSKLEANVAGKNKRNTFACVGCHSLKQKCVPSDPDDIYRKPCARCMKQKKKCRFDLAKRTRKRKGRSSRPDSEIIDKTSPIDNNSPTPSTSLAMSPVVQSPGLLSQKKSYIDMATALNGNNIDSNVLAGERNDNSTFFPNALPVPQNIVNMESNNMNLWQPMSQDSMNNVKTPNNAIPNFIPGQANPLTEQDLLNNGKDYSQSNNNTTNKTGNNFMTPMSNDMSKQSSTLLNNQMSTLNNNTNERSNSSGLELLQNAIFSNPANMTTSPTGLNTSTSANRNTQSNVSSPLNPAQMEQSIAIINTNKRSRPNNDDPNNDTDRLSSIKKRPQYHMKHEFKKNLQSLLIVLKGKISEVSNKFNSWSTQWNKLVESSMFLPTISDPVSIGIISLDEAKLRLKLYTEVIAYQSRLPFVHIPKGASINDIRRDKPIFFSVVMSIVSIIMTEEQTTRDTVMRLDSFVINLITMQIFKLNNKSIEVIEALVTLCMWYNFLEWSNKTRYHLFNYIVCCLTKDLGPTSVNKSFGMFNDEDPYKHQPRSKTQLEAAENGPVLTMLVYISALNISIYLRQTVQARWNRLTQGAMEKIDYHVAELRGMVQSGNSTDENITSLNLQIDENTMLITFAKLNHLLEKIHVHLHEMKDLRDDEVPSDHHLTEEYTQRLIDRYQRELDEVFKEIPKSRSRLLAFYYSVEAYLHQFTLGDFMRKETIDKDTILPSNVTRAFLRCYDCCTNSLNEFLKLSSTLIASLPLFHMSRIIYIVGMLMLKLRYSVVSIPTFHHLIDITDGTIDLVKQVSTRLEHASKTYPFNNGLYKFQYVVALFGQTYATKVTELAERMEKSQSQNNTNSATQFNSQLMYSVGKRSPSKTNLNQMSKSNLSLNTMNNTTSPDNNSDIMSCISGDPNIMPKLDAKGHANYYVKNENGLKILGVGKEPNNDSKKEFSFQMNPLGDANNNKSSSNISSGHQSGIRTSSPSIASDNLNEYLTDINSLALGYNALNDEFWTDLLFSSM